MSFSHAQVPLALTRTFDVVQKPQINAVNLFTEPTDVTNANLSDLWTGPRASLTRSCNSDRVARAVEEHVLYLVLYSVHCVSQFLSPSINGGTHTAGDARSDLKWVCGDGFHTCPVASRNEPPLRTDPRKACFFGGLALSQAIRGGGWGLVSIKWDQPNQKHSAVVPLKKKILPSPPASPREH